ncbi:hypothetical protein IQ238_19835 [Pleurocapsales cyanobacterium LEGE 06147]|nr:hypothetical protein [Pleurocapsales cyanobacterium LEGE 06147]
MSQQIKISDRFTVGQNQPKEQDLHFKSVINLRTENEKDQPLSPQEEGEFICVLDVD